MFIFRFLARYVQELHRFNFILMRLQNSLLLLDLVHNLPMNLRRFLQFLFLLRHWILLLRRCLKHSFFFFRDFYKFLVLAPNVLDFFCFELNAERRADFAWKVRFLENLALFFDCGLGFDDSCGIFGFFFLKLRNAVLGGFLLCC